MADVAKRMAGPVAVSTSSTVVYTVPANTTAILRNIHAVNTVINGAATFTLAIGSASTTANQLFSQHSIAGLTVLDWSGFLVMNATETIQVMSGTANSLVLTISGVEVS